jgi:hypothetical protein
MKVVIMGNKNSVTYVQRLIDNILREVRESCRAYIDDLFIATETLPEHVGCCL